jgi:hypothetical protein
VVGTAERGLAEGPQAEWGQDDGGQNEGGITGLELGLKKRDTQGSTHFCCWLGSQNFCPETAGWQLQHS